MVNQSRYLMKISKAQEATKQAFLGDKKILILRDFNYKDNDSEHESRWVRDPWVYQFFECVKEKFLFLQVLSILEYKEQTHYQYLISFSHTITSKYTSD